MRIVLFGASGMVGQGALRECLLAPDVEQVVAVGRSELPKTAATRVAGAEAKKVSLVVSDLFDLSAMEDRLRGMDACFFCLGMASSGVSKVEYRRVTYDLTLAVAKTLLRWNPQMVFVFVSGAGTDTQSRAAWARVKGRTEGALLAMPFRAAYMLRPGFIQPLDGIRSKTRLYQAFYDLLGPVLPLLRRMFSGSITTTEQMGQTMLRLVREGHVTNILEARDITAL